MDDNQFDDILKKKLGDYEDPNFDPEALAGLHHRLDARLISPWYSRYRSELVTTSAIALCTFIIILSQWYWAEKNISTLTNSTHALAEQNEVIAKLEWEIIYLKSIKRDTIRTVVYLNQDSKTNNTLLNRLADLEEILKNIQENNSLVKDDASAKSFVNYLADTSLEISSAKVISRRIQPNPAKRISLKAKTDEALLANLQIYASGKSKLSAEAIRDIQKHYQHGVDIHAGPTVELSKGFYRKGNGKVNMNFGVLMDLIFSPALSLETGFKYNKRYYEITNANDIAQTSLPYLKPSLGTLRKGEIDSWMFEVPLNLKYRYPLNMETNIIGGIGYSSLLYWKQVLEYHYEPDGGGDFSTIDVHEINDFKLNPGTANILIGFDKELKNKNIFEGSLYYQGSVGRMGVEKSKPGYFGVRAVYWLNVKK